MQWLLFALIVLIIGICGFMVGFVCGHERGKMDE